MISPVCPECNGQMVAVDGGYDGVLLGVEMYRCEVCLNEHFNDTWSDLLPGNTNLLETVVS